MPPVLDGTRDCVLSKHCCQSILAALLLPQELEAAQQEGEEADDPMAWACQRFWKRRAAPLPLSRSLGRLRRCGGLGGWQAPCMHPSSLLG